MNTLLRVCLHAYTLLKLAAKIEVQGATEESILSFIPPNSAQTKQEIRHSPKISDLKVWKQLAQRQNVSSEYAGHIFNDLWFF